MKTACYGYVSFLCVKKNTLIANILFFTLQTNLVNMAQAIDIFTQYFFFTLFVLFGIWYAIYTSESATHKGENKMKIQAINYGLQLRLNNNGRIAVKQIAQVIDNTKDKKNFKKD